MEQVRDLNMEADDMQVVLSALKGVSKRIKEVEKVVQVVDFQRAQGAQQVKAPCRGRANHRLRRWL